MCVREGAKRVYKQGRVDDAGEEDPLYNERTVMENLREQCRRGRLRGMEYARIKCMDKEQMETLVITSSLRDFQAMCVRLD